MRVFFSMPASMRPLYNVVFGIQYSSSSVPQVLATAFFYFRPHSLSLHTGLIRIDPGPSPLDPTTHPR